MKEEQLTQEKSAQEITKRSGPFQFGQKDKTIIAKILEKERKEKEFKEQTK